jgi:3-oxoacyl-[acyl-carrier-protein] synthase-3
MTIGADCASFVPQLTVAARLVESGSYETALIIQGNTASRVMDWRRPASVGVGDGAVASVVSRVPQGHGFMGSFMGTMGEHHATVRIAPAGEPKDRWHAGATHQSDLVFQSMDDAGMARTANRSVTFAREACEKVLADSQPTDWFGAACCEALGVLGERTLHTFPKYAHLMPASLPINLWTAHEQGRLRNGDLVLGYTPGAGFIQAAMLMRWTHRQSWS